MIFAIAEHPFQIIAGTKTQTRRRSDKYQVGKTYAIQEGRGKTGLRVGRIKITRKWEEFKWIYFGRLAFIKKPISKEDAQAEGLYTPKEYEELYEKMYPGWRSRWAYEFEFQSSSGSAKK